MRESVLLKVELKKKDSFVLLDSTLFMLFCPLLVGLEIKARLVSTRHYDLVRVASDCVTANDNVAVGIDLSAVSFHCIVFLVCVIETGKPVGYNHKTTKRDNTQEKRLKSFARVIARETGILNASKLQ